MLPPAVPSPELRKGMGERAGRNTTGSKKELDPQRFGQGSLGFRWKRKAETHESLCSAYPSSWGSHSSVRNRSTTFCLFCLASYGISLMDSPPFSPPCGPEHFELLLPHLLLGMACVTAGNSAASPRHIPAAHPCGTARPPHVCLSKGRGESPLAGMWLLAPPRAQPRASGVSPAASSRIPARAGSSRICTVAEQDFSIPNSFVSRAWLKMLQIPFL